ncbi:MAG: DinB family protein [Bacteroidetes bacterium]|nr:DinB family protein [Bacteroidota bacterium]
MFRKIEDFISDWGYEHKSTLKVFKNITDECLNKKNHETVRSIAVLAWHITITLNEMLNKAGLLVTGPDEHSQPPATIAEIISDYENSALSVTKQVKKQWNDNTLLEDVTMYGNTWKKGTVLSVLIKHQSHHRGQLTVLMRHAGLKVPGVYGPSKEEWAAWNVPAME